MRAGREIHHLTVRVSRVLAPLVHHGLAVNVQDGSIVSRHRERVCAAMEREVALPAYREVVRAYSRARTRRSPVEANLWIGADETSSSGRAESCIRVIAAGEGVAARSGA